MPGVEIGHSDLRATRAAVAALSDADRLAVFARIVAAGADGVAMAEIRGLSEEPERAVGLLIGAGLAVADDGRTRVVVAAEGLGRSQAELDDLWERMTPELLRRDDIAPFVEEGRLARLPKHPDTRRAVLAAVAVEVFVEYEVYSEPEVNRLLGALCVDHVRVRRALVDERMLDRTPDGSRYRMV